MKTTQNFCLKQKATIFNIDSNLKEEKSIEANTKKTVKHKLIMLTTADLITIFATFILAHIAFIVFIHDQMVKLKIKLLNKLAEQKLKNAFDEFKKELSSSKDNDFDDVKVLLFIILTCLAFILVVRLFGTEMRYLAKFFKKSVTSDDKTDIKPIFGCSYWDFRIF